MASFDSGFFYMTFSLDGQIHHVFHIHAANLVTPAASGNFIFWAVTWPNCCASRGVSSRTSRRWTINAGAGQRQTFIGQRDGSSAFFRRATDSPGGLSGNRVEIKFNQPGELTLQFVVDGTGQDNNSFQPHSATSTDFGEVL